ncbi:MAG: hypothetical protein M1814_004217 [Vezdaea aestivalis]|nr:MAG: hypothetical protein M1814_004217 [Vezdaea aestivalis]
MALPLGLSVGFNHTSTPPTKCDSLYAAPPGHRNKKTFCESHLLAVSIKAGAAENNTNETLAFALEVLIYTTTASTTLFVSKADSTGYLHLLKQPKSIVSPVRIVSQVFLSHLIKARRRPGIQLIVSLFARAQDQYLFPGSVENSGKHVLDDKGLIKWWCKILDPILREYRPSSNPPTTTTPTSTAYLTVPGYDRHEILALLPLSARLDPAEAKRWVHGHPLHLIAKHPDAPPRCLVPRFPDDPKARFINELDEEVLDQNGRLKVTTKGSWKSVKTMDHFWEMMQFRQECSSGRLVGFAWVVINPSVEETEEPKDDDVPQSQQSVATDLSEGPLLPTPQDSQTAGGWDDGQPKHNKIELVEPLSPRPSPSRHSKMATSRQKHWPKGPLQSRMPDLKSFGSSSKSLNVPEDSRHYLWTREGRGNIIITENNYQRLHELLLRLDFADLDIAQQSTKRWMEELALFGSLESEVLIEVTGKLEPVAEDQNRGPAITQLLVGKKRGNEVRQGQDDNGVSTLPTGLVRKKPKVTNDESSKSINTIGAGLIRKKAKK